MAGEAHFEIYPEHDSYGEKTGQFLWRFQFANGDIGPVSLQRYRDRTDANRGIHDFLEAAFAFGSPHPPIVDVGK